MPSLYHRFGRSERQGDDRAIAVEISDVVSVASSLADTLEPSAQ
jgi:hypothetical protein